MIVSNEQDFFADFEATYPLASLPVKSVSFGNEWELYCASLAETSARVKRATEKLRPAEALAAIESQLDPSFMNGREADRDLAFMDLGLYLEHDFGMAGAPGGQPTISARIQWQKRLAGEIDAYVDDLHADGVTALGRRIPGGGGATRFFAFNPLGWQRSAPADFPYAGPTPFHVVDVATQAEVRSQLVTAGGPTRIRILAEDVPSLGYRVYEVRPGAGTSFPPAASVNGGQMLSARYSLTVAGDGAITSLVDRAQNGREFAEQIGGLWLNDPGTGSGSLTVEDAGPVSVTLRADSSQPLQHTTRVTLYTGVPRVDIENRITQNFSSDQTWSFGFELTSPRVRHEEVGAILEARLDSQGGHYSSRNARYDWLTLNHFADISGSDGAGVTLSNADCYFFKLGNSSVSTLDVNTPRLTVLAGGRPNSGNGLPDQGGDTLFVQRFALQAHDGYSATDAMRMALEHQNPLVCGAVTSSASALPADVFSALSISDPDVLLWAFKPAEEGIADGLIARVWNVTNQPQSADLQLAPSADRQRARHDAHRDRRGPSSRSAARASASCSGRSRCAPTACCCRDGGSARGGPAGRDRPHLVHGAGRAGPEAQLGPQQAEGLGQDRLGPRARAPPGLGLVVLRSRRADTDPHAGAEGHAIQQPCASRVGARGEDVDRLERQPLACSPLAHHDRRQEGPLLGRCGRRHRDHASRRQAELHQRVRRELRVGREADPVRPVADRPARGHHARVSARREGLRGAFHALVTQPALDHHQVRADRALQRQEWIQAIADQERAHQPEDDQKGPAPEGWQPHLPALPQSRTSHGTQANRPQRRASVEQRLDGALEAALVGGELGGGEPLHAVQGQALAVADAHRGEDRAAPEGLGEVAHQQRVHRPGRVEGLHDQRAVALQDAFRRSGLGLVHGDRVDQDAVDPALEDGGWREPPHRVDHEQPVRPAHVLAVARAQRVRRRARRQGLALPWCQPQDRIEAVRQQVVQPVLDARRAQGLEDHAEEAVAQALGAAVAEDDKDAARSAHGATSSGWR